MPSEFESFDKHKRIAALKQATLFKFDSFEQATDRTIIEFIDRLRQYEKSIDAIKNNIPDVDENVYEGISPDEWALIDEYSDLHMKKDFTKEYLLSLLEMKVVYLFKSLETMMKRIIQTAYPKSNTKDLHQWENMKAFFKSREIDLIHLVGYNECTDLRKVNNSIKHKGFVNPEIKGIEEFSGETEFDHINLESFYKRIRPKVEQFSAQLRDKVENDLFDFPLDRLQRIVNDFFDRMDEITFNSFVTLLNEKRIRHYRNDAWEPPGVSDFEGSDLPF